MLQGARINERSCVALNTLHWCALFLLCRREICAGLSGRFDCCFARRRCGGGLSDNSQNGAGPIAAGFLRLVSPMMAERR